MRIVADSAVLWLGRGHVVAERSSNSAVYTAHVGALRIVKKNRFVGYKAVYSSRSSPRFEVAYFILRVGQYLKVEAVIFCETSVDFYQSCASHPRRLQLIFVSWKTFEISQCKCVESVVT